MQHCWILIAETNIIIMRPQSRHNWIRSVGSDQKNWSDPIFERAIDPIWLKFFGESTDPIHFSAGSPIRSKRSRSFIISTFPVFSIYGLVDRFSHFPKCPSVKTMWRLAFYSIFDFDPRFHKIKARSDFHLSDTTLILILWTN